MDGEQDGAQAQGAPVEGQQGEQARPQGDQDSQKDGAQEVAGGGAGGGAADYQAALRAKDARIAELSAKVAETAKTSEATEELNQQIAALKQQMTDERTEFALKAAGVRNVKAARALLDDYEGDVDALRAGEPWMFAQVGGTSQNTSQIDETSITGATGLEPAGVAGGGDSAYMRRWERIAGLTEEKE